MKILRIELRNNKLTYYIERDEFLVLQDNINKAFSTLTNEKLSDIAKRNNITKQHLYSKLKTINNNLLWLLNLINNDITLEIHYTNPKTYFLDDDYEEPSF